MARNGGRTGPAWDAARAECLRRSNICAACGEPIDMSLSGRHPWGPTADHIVALEDGGALLDQANLQPMHRTENIAKENRLRRARRHKQTLNTSRNW